MDKLPAKHTKAVHKIGSGSEITCVVEDNVGRQFKYDLVKLERSTYNVLRMNGEKVIGPPLEFIAGDEQDPELIFEIGAVLQFKSLTDESTIALGRLCDLVITRRKL